MTDREGRVISLPIEGRPSELKVIHVHERPEAPAPQEVAPPRPWSPPVTGALAMRQFSWAAIGMITALAALATSIWFWTLLGAGWLASWVASYLI